MQDNGRKVDYWLSVSLVQRGVKNRFGIRIQDGICWALIQVRDDEARTFGKPHEIPVDLSNLPPYLRIAVDELCETFPNLMDTLTAKNSPAKIGPQRAG